METKEIPELKVIGLEITTTVQECATNNPHPKLWRDFMKRVDEIKNRVGTNFYGICIETSKQECNFTSMACVEVEDLSSIPEGMVSKTVPASKYAIWTHKGKLDNLTDTYKELYEKTIPESGLKPKTIWLELYDERYKHDSEDSEFDICVQVE